MKGMCAFSLASWKPRDTGFLRPLTMESSFPDPYLPDPPGWIQSKRNHTHTWHLTILSMHSCFERSGMEGPMEPHALSGVGHFLCTNVTVPTQAGIAFPWQEEL